MKLYVIRHDKQIVIERINIMVNWMKILMRLG